MIKITNKEWRNIQTYASLMQIACLTQANKDENNMVYYMLKYDSGTKSKDYKDGRLPFPKELKEKDWQVLPNLFQNINRRNKFSKDNYGMKLFSPLIKKYLKSKKSK